jgi:atypical dual specificity phosphatase
LTDDPGPAAMAAHHELDDLRAAGDAHELPHRDCYWVLPRRLLAGPYPEIQLHALLDAGVDCFVDLTRGEPLAPYALTAQGRARWHGFAITDFSTPGVELMRRIVDTIDDELARGARVYLHCHAGVGRTGTAVGCWLVERGFTGGEALRLIAHKRQALLGQSPETEAQREFVRRWRARQPKVAA